MADDDSPRPFRRERNLSRHRFPRRGSSRRFSTESHSSRDSQSTDTTIDTTISNSNENITNSRSSPSSNFQYSYSVNSDTENGFQQKSMRLQGLQDLNLANDEMPQTPTTPDPALLDVKQKVKRFETLTAEERIIFKTGKYHSRYRHATTSVSPLQMMPIIASGSDVENSSPPIDSKHSVPTTPTLPPNLPSTSPPNMHTLKKQTSSLYRSIDEVHSEDEVEDIAADAVAVDDRPLDALDSVSDIIPASKNDDDEFGETENMRRTLSAKDALDVNVHSSDDAELELPKMMAGGANNDFPRNYRSTPRPKTEIVATTNRNLIGQFASFRTEKKDEEPEEVEEEIELRDKCAKYIQPILDELINTEETYVKSLFNGIKNYGNIFTRKDLPLALHGKKYVLFGNIEQIAEFHRDEFLPMLLRNQRDLKRLFDEFQDFIEQNCFYGYVIFTMNKQKSLKLCDDNKTYFKHLQSELDDKLGINSFLVQPIQRIGKYPLLLKEFITTLFKHRDFAMKPLIESCCRLDKKIRTLLTTTNESEVINDVVDCHEFNVFYQGKFRKVSEFNIIDHTLRRTYRGKVFIFDKCILFTEIKGKALIFRGRYPCEHIGVVAKTKHFTLYYEKPKQQEADFHADPAQIELWLDLIRDMIKSYAAEERRKLRELYSRDSDHKHRKPSSLSLFRDSNRFSSDSGIGNIWVMPKPEVAEDALSNRTTWYQ